MEKEAVEEKEKRVRFSPKYRLPVVTDYRRDPGSEFWDGFPTNRSREAKSLVSPVQLLCLAHGVGGVDMEIVEKVVKDLQEGAVIGCRGAAREGSVSRNASSCFDYPAQITDAIAGWLAKGFAAGPFLKQELPEGAKVNGMMCRVKPTGAVRVILNLSAPAGRSVNDGIDSDEFPTVMSSTGQWLECLNRAGRGCMMTKIDWSDAYKHIHVHRDDQDLQWFEWMGRFFVELCLVFGAASSPGIYDRLAKLVLDLAVKLSGFPRNMVCQYLDDVCAAMRAGSPALARFREAYFSVSEQLGVRLSPEDDPDKAFAPRTSGVVLGVLYVSVSWTWSIPVGKLRRLEEQVALALEADTMAQGDIWSLVGRIVHYCPLVPAGRINIGHLIWLNSVSTSKAARVAVDAAAKRQLAFWRLILKTSSGLASIPRPAAAAPAWALEFFTDAAGGSGATVGLGCRGVVGSWWFYVPWGRKINTGVKWKGSKLSQKMSALELVGPLICVAGGYERVRNRQCGYWWTIVVRCISGGRAIATGAGCALRWCQLLRRWRRDWAARCILRKWGGARRRGRGWRTRCRRLLLGCVGRSGGRPAGIWPRRRPGCRRPFWHGWRIPMMTGIWGRTSCWSCDSVPWCLDIIVEQCMSMEIYV